MAKNARKTRRKVVRRHEPSELLESRASDAMTIVWTVSVTSVFVADIVVIAAHLYARSDPSAKSARVLEAIMLLSAAAMGVVSLTLLPIVWRTRRLKPPQGYVVFATLVAAAPIIALVERLWL
jgi:hypothetical protein